MLILDVRLETKIKFRLDYCCLDCSGKLSKWFSGKKVDMGFAVPMIWREQRDHITDCYFCLTKTKGYVVSLHEYTGLLKNNN